MTKLVLAAGAISAAAVAAAGLPEIALGLGALTIAGTICAAGAMFEAERIAYRAVEECATELNLSPLGNPVRARSRVAVAAGAEKPVGAPISAQNADS